MGVATFYLEVNQSTGMLGKDRFLSRLRMEGSPSTPVFLRELTLSMDVTGITTPSMYGPPYDSKASAASVIAFQKIMGHDAVVGCAYTYSLDAFGGKTKFPEMGAPYFSAAPFANPSAIDGRDPSEICDSLLEGMKESCSIVRDALPYVAMVMNVGGPVNTAGNLRGVETFLMDTISEPDIAEAMVEFGTGIMKEIIGFMGNELFDAVFIAAASDNPDMLGPEDYRKYTLGPMAGIVSDCDNMGLPLIMHPHGNFSADDRICLLKETAGIGISGFQFGEGNDPTPINEAISEKCSVMGGVDAYTTLLLGPEKRIQRDVWGFLDVLEGDGHIATCSCSLNRGLPLENVRQMVKAVRSWRPSA